MKSEIKMEKSSSSRNKQLLAESGNAFDGRPARLPVKSRPSAGKITLGSPPPPAGSSSDEVEEDPYKSPLENYDEKRYRQYWRLAAAEELDELSDHSADGFFDANDEVHSYDATPDSGIHELAGLDAETRARMEEEWRSQLLKVEDEIMTLRQVLQSKLNESQELKRKLGITAWKEFRDDMEQGLKNIQESTAYKGVSDKLVEWNSAVASAPIYQKTSSTLKVATEKTSSTLSTLGASVSKKLGDVKNSNAFKSFEEKVGTAYSSVKTKVSNSRSSSVTSFEQALNNLDGRSASSNAATPLTSPTIPETKTIA